jgi:hypothetical protein
MKPSPNADYPIQVYPQSWEEGSLRAPLYQGVFSMVLNYVVEVAFVPDVSAAAPPWVGRELPANLDEVSTPEQARLATALLAKYAVTPNDARAGDVAYVRWPLAEGPIGDGWIRYVSAVEFARYAAELDRLSEIVSSRFPDKTVSDLRDYEVVRFIEREVVAAPWFAPSDAVMLGRIAAQRRERKD